MPTTEHIDSDGDVEMLDAGSSEPPSTVTSGHKREDPGYVDSTGRFTTDEAFWDSYVSDVGQMYFLKIWATERDAEGFGNINVCSSVGDLPNDVHPLFARQRWILEDFVTNSDSNVWRDLELALRLASRMLRSPPVMAFLCKVKFGREVADPTSGRVYIVDNTSKSIGEANAEALSRLHCHRTGS
jgi:hypothetical protein